MTNTLEKFRTSFTGKVLVMGLLVLALLIPMNMVESVIADRSHVYRTAEEDITGSWGKEVTLIDPIFTIEEHGQLKYSNHGYTYEHHYKHLSPEKLFINGHIDTQVRRRGIFKVPVYIGNITIKGYFNLPRDENIGTDVKREAKFQILLNARSIRKPPELTWDGEKIPLTAEKISDSNENAVFNARLNNVPNNDSNQYLFELALALSGSNALTFHSKAQQSNIRLMSNWNSPSFFGPVLPTSHNIKDTGFSAEWNTNNFFTDLGREDSELIALDWFPGNANYGVKFIQPVDTYQLVTRATKYAILFMTLIFAVYLLYEILGSVILHPIQYLFIGFSNCIFYLLLLSLAEHIDFKAAYFISAVSSALLIALYSMCILKRRVHGALIFVKLSLLYTFLYTTLKSEDYALLIGSVGLFIILSLIMYFTRNFNWYRTANVQT